MVRSDEFEGPAGQLSSAANWAFDIGTDWGNRQLEYDTGRPENVLAGPTATCQERT